MNRYVLLENGVVANVIIWDGDEPYTDNVDALPIPEDSQVGIGWELVDGEWVAPVSDDVEVAEQTLAREQERQAVRQAALSRFIALGWTREQAELIIGS